MSKIAFHATNRSHLAFIQLILTAVAIGFTAGCIRSTGDSTIEPQSMSHDESHRLMVETLDEIARRAPDENRYVGDLMTRQLRIELQNTAADAPWLTRWLKTYQLAKSELNLGNEIEAIRLYEKANGILEGHAEQLKPEFLHQFFFDHAICHLRLGESQNCCQRHSAASCIVPIQGDAVHVNQTGSRNGILWLKNLLQMLDEDEPMHLAARWLLNLAFMTLGEYPESVPKAYLIPHIGATAKEENSFHPVSSWPNIAEDVGLATFSLAGGAIADDFDLDNDTDLVVSCYDPRVSLKIFWNDGNGEFTEGTEAANLGSILGGLNMVQTDFNNDGNLDIFVMRGGWLATGGQHPNSLLRNNGDGTFTDVTLKAGLALPKLPTQTAAWADYDLDGDLDVYIGNESSNKFAAPSQLFRNNGDETFTDVAPQAGVSNNLLAKSVIWGDYDGDRYPDLYVSNYRGTNRLYRNKGDGTFEDIANRLQVSGPEASFPCWFCDVNQDGRLDLFVSAYAGGISEIAASHLDKPFNREATMPRLYLNREGKGFHENALEMGFTQPTHPMGANFGDINNDGFPDFYFGTGWPEYHELMPNVLMANMEGSRFQDITNAAHVGHLQKGHAVAMADFDNDGDVDIFEQMGGFVPGDKFYDVLFKNPGTTQNWIKLKLVGTQSNRAAIGARIHVIVRDAMVTRSIYRWVNSGGSFGANPLEQHIGLGSATRIEKVEVLWPKTGKTSTHEELKINKRFTLTEPTL